MIRDALTIVVWLVLAIVVARWTQSTVDTWMAVP